MGTSFGCMGGYSLPCKNRPYSIKMTSGSLAAMVTIASCT